MSVVMKSVVNSDDGRTVTAIVNRSELVESCQCCPARPYLEIDVPHEMISVEKLTIVTISHDQGFSNTEEADRGTYNSSFTWFEVVVISESNHERSPAKDVQRNVHASRERKRHENVYDVRDDDDTRRWLSTIHGGDTIQLVMRAEFPAWVNYCYKAEIKLVGTAVDSDTIRPSFEASVTSKSPNIYAALNQSSRDIRVLAISPASFNEPIHCSLKIVSLDDDKIQSYDALSYCWGNLPADKFIELDVESLSGEGGEAHQLALSTTLFEALRHLRPQTGYPKLLWVDFICINQSDLVERAAQVGIMPKIYSRAEKVHVWLGSSDVVTQRVMRDVMDVASRYDDGSIEADEGQTEKIKQRHGPVFPGHLEDRMLTFVSDWRSCDFAWFRRTWVLQEVANSKSAVVHCGRDVVPWSVILRLAYCFIKAKRITSLFRYSIMPPIFTSLFRLENNVVVDAPRRSGRGILEILVAGHDLEASDPKDKIFALLQFGRETSELERLPSLIRPDYAKSVARVFADFTRWWIMTHKSLRVLSAVHTNKDRAWQQMSSGLPVDLDSLNRPTWCFWHGGASSWAKATLALSETTPYRSSGDSVPDMALLAGDVDEPMHLRLRGLRVCTVESIQLYPMFRRTSTSEMEKAFFRIFDPTGLQKTWIWNREEQTIPPPSNAFEDEDSLNRLGEHYSAHWQFVRQTGGAVPCCSPCHFRGIKCERVRKEDGEDSVCGLCPHNARVSDIVVLLEGGNVPYLLRRLPDCGSPGKRKGDDEDGDERDEREQEELPDGHTLFPEYYQFVGECFADGYMNGEAWRSLVSDLGSSGLKTFTLV